MGNWKPEKVLSKAQIRSKNRNLKYNVATANVITLRPLKGWGVKALAKVLAKVCMLVDMCCWVVCICRFVWIYGLIVLPDAFGRGCHRPDCPAIFRNRLSKYST